MEDSDWCLASSSTDDGLECSEDICYEDAETSEDGCGETLCNEQHLGSTHRPDVPLDAGVEIGAMDLIRAELGRQREMYSNDAQFHLKVVYGSSLKSAASRAASMAAATPPHASHPCADQPISYPGGAWACGSGGGVFCPAAAPERVYGGWPESSLADRCLLVGWMLDLTRAAQLQRETLFLATSLLDRFMAATSGSTFELPERMLQLLAMACVSVAMKFEEVAPLHSADLVRLAVDHVTGAPLYQTSDLGQMEWRLLWVLDWRARAPTSLSFLQHFLLCCGPASAASAAAGPEAWAAAGCASGGGIRRRNADAPGAAAGAAAAPAADGSVGQEDPHGEAEHSLEVWAHRILDLALLHHCDLVHCHSTVAIASIALAERAVAAAAAAPPPPGAYGAYTPLAVAAPFYTRTRGPCLVAVQMATGLSMDELAPNLSPCVTLLEHLCAREQQGLLQPSQSWPPPPPPTQQQQPSCQLTPPQQQQQQQSPQQGQQLHPSPQQQQPQFWPPPQQQLQQQQLQQSAWGCGAAIGQRAF